MDSISIIELIKANKTNSKENRCCKYCGVKLEKKFICVKCTNQINNFKLKKKGYFKEYYSLNHENIPKEQQKKRGRKPKPKDEISNDKPIED